MAIGFKITKLFFDRKSVQNRVKKTTRRILSRFGAFVRQTAKKSIRKRKKPSSPGKPPSSHIGLLKKFIFFGYDPGKDSVVIGPVRLTKKGRGEAPSLLEYGGTTKVKARGKKKKRKRTKIRPRPFMGPAFEKEKTKLPAMWRDSIKK